MHLMAWKPSCGSVLCVCPSLLLGAVGKQPNKQPASHFLARWLRFVSWDVFPSEPLTTLKDAYYDVTSKPLDEVWQEKTEEYMRKIQAFLPAVVKDVWLMEPMRMALKGVKAGLDMVGITRFSIFNGLKIRLTNLSLSFELWIHKNC